MDVMTLPFIKGLDLAELFYEEAVRPLLARRFSDLPYAAARLGGGSDVLGFDTPQSRDHDWGPRLTLFLRSDDLAAWGTAVDETLRRELPPEVRGYPTHYGRHPDGTTHLQPHDGGPVNHLVELTTVAAFAHDYLRYDVAAPLRPADWLSFPQQHLATIRYGRVFHDGVGEVTALRQRLHYYPRDVWLYLLVGQWVRIAQEEAFVGRCGDVGDELGSRLLAARQVQNVMRLCFLMAQAYAPYPKWFGSAFARLPDAAALTPLFERVWQAADWQAREAALSAVYEFAARRHNQLAITPPLEGTVSHFYERPYLVIHAERFADAIRAQITDPAVQALPHGLGGVDQLFDSTDVLSEPRRFARARALFQPEA